MSIRIPPGDILRHSAVSTTYALKYLQQGMSPRVLRTKSFQDDERCHLALFDASQKRFYVVVNVDEKMEPVRFKIEDIFELIVESGQDLKELSVPLGAMDVF